MTNSENQHTNWTICKSCQGNGKTSQRIRKKDKIKYQNDLAIFKKCNSEASPPEPPKSHLIICSTCKGTGLLASEFPTIPNTENYPHIAIIGAGIGGVALAVACLHRGIPFTLFERDSRFDARSQGYGLTLQQASKAIAGFGIVSLQEGIVSTRHLVHTTDGIVIGEWGKRKWLHNNEEATTKRTNIHIARQTLRLAILEQLGGNEIIQWGHQLLDFKQNEDQTIQLHFQVKGAWKSTQADIVVGADGIRSVVRKLLFGNNFSPLRYLDCMVILGICPLENIKNTTSDLLDGATVFQTANGNERIYMMPFAIDAIMWQLSFPIAENEAKILHTKGAKALQEEADKRTQWHAPIPEIIAATPEASISGYPVYDRALLQPETLANAGQITLLGDAAHPMSPFKGQGANQALLDALSLARAIYKGCKPNAQWRKSGIRECVLTHYEQEMLTRSATKVKESAAAADFLHSEIVLQQADEPRGRRLKRKED
jgi:2-polyprenyl-6-methoxyphenol hydroxylase-like FAD-dependent oxidoreductase